jgi:hypothetical protein
MGISRRGHKARRRSTPIAEPDAPTTAPPSHPGLSKPDPVEADPARPPLTRLHWPERDVAGPLPRSAPVAPPDLPWPEPDAPEAASTSAGVEADGAHDDGAATPPVRAERGIASIADERAHGPEQVAQQAQVERAAAIRRAEQELAAAVRAVELALAANTRPARR